MRPIAIVGAAVLALLPFSGCQEGERYVETVMGAQDRAEGAAFETSLRAYATAIESYQLDDGRYPATLADLPEVSSGRLPRTDPWGGDLVLRVEGASYELRSSGPDGQPRTEDDVVLRDGHIE